MRTTDQVFADALRELVNEIRPAIGDSERVSRLDALWSELYGIANGKTAEPQGGEGEYVVWRWMGDRWCSIGVWSNKYEAESQAKWERSRGLAASVVFAPAPPPPTETPGKESSDAV